MHTGVSEPAEMRAEFCLCKRALYTCFLPPTLFPLHICIKYTCWFKYIYVCMCIGLLPELSLSLCRCISIMQIYNSKLEEYHRLLGIYAWCYEFKQRSEGGIMRFPSFYVYFCPYSMNICIYIYTFCVSKSTK